MNRVARIALTALIASPAFAQSDQAKSPVYRFYVACESADEVHRIAFDGQHARVERVIDVGYQPTEIEGPHGLAVSLDGDHWFLSIAHGKPFGLLYKYRTEDDELVGEYMINALRLKAGFELAECAARTGLRAYAPELLGPLHSARAKGWLEQRGGHLKPTALGYRYLNDLQGLFIEPAVQAAPDASSPRAIDSTT